MTDLEIIDRIEDKHRETVLILTRVERKLDKLDRFRLKVITYSTGMSMIVSILWTIVTKLPAIAKLLPTVEMGK